MTLPTNLPEFQYHGCLRKHVLSGCKNGNTVQNLSQGQITLRADRVQTSAETPVSDRAPQLQDRAENEKALLVSARDVMVRKERLLRKG